ncbi:hypothetical protein BC940DRAFT_298604 [Gongronella butleri]|nr:hypothetical protein BC940DRAFT_298604 [Gongronella butleri]
MVWRSMMWTTTMTTMTQVSMCQWTQLTRHAPLVSFCPANRMPYYDVAFLKSMVVALEQEKANSNPWVEARAAQNCHCCRICRICFCFPRFLSFSLSMLTQLAHWEVQWTRAC